MDKLSPNPVVKRINAKYFLRESASHLRKATNAIQLSGTPDAYSLLSTANLLDEFIKNEIKRLENHD